MNSLQAKLETKRQTLTELETLRDQVELFRHQAYTDDKWICLSTANMLLATSQCLSQAVSNARYTIQQDEDFLRITNGCLYSPENVTYVSTSA